MMTPYRHWALLLVLLLVGCGTLGSKPQPAPTEPTAKPAPGTPAAKRGGYYLDDGPGDNPPADIDAIPDAVPKAEPLFERANRPYVALGQNYTPMTAFQPYRESGVASWYGRRYHGNKTSSGEVYDMYGMTAAHPTLPIPSYVRVSNPENGRTVVVRVNDRGPFRKDRLIDLSYAAAYKLRLTGKGSGQVEVEAIDTGNRLAQDDATTARAKAAYAAAYSLRNSKVSPGGNVEIPVTAAAVPAPLPAKAVTEPPQAAPEAPKAQPVAEAKVAGAYIQVGAFKRKENAEQLIGRLRQQSIVSNELVRSWYNDGIYRVRLGPYASTEDVERVAAQIRQQLGITNLVITQQETP